MRDNRKSEIHFSYEDLEVWQKTIDFANEVIGIVDKLIT